MSVNFFNNSIKTSDPEVYATLQKELERQQNQIELIASENIASKAVLNAQGSVMTNKYAEGYPGNNIMVAVNLLIKPKILLLRE